MTSPGQLPGPQPRRLRGGPGAHRGARRARRARCSARAPRPACIRYITNKPKLNVTEGSVNAGYGITADGDPNTNVTAVLNLPLIADTLAVRGVIYNDTRGGYINNVPAHLHAQGDRSGYLLRAIIRTAAAPTHCRARCRRALPRSTTTTIAASAINPVTYRAPGLGALEDQRRLERAAHPELPEHGCRRACSTRCRNELGRRSRCRAQSVTLFNPSYNKDQFENTAWTVNGKIGDAARPSTPAPTWCATSSQLQDYTNYARGVYADYYQCHGAEPANGLAATCFSPSATWNETERNTHQSHEFRLSTPDDWRLRGIVGAFWEKLQIYDQLELAVQDPADLHRYA